MCPNSKKGSQKTADSLDFDQTALIRLLLQDLSLIWVYNLGSLW